MNMTKMVASIKCSLEKLRTNAACAQDGFVEGGLDNTHTDYTHTNQAFLTTFDDGTTDVFNVASATDWTDQVSQMSAGLDSIMPWAQTVEPFCNILPNGCGGLPAPRLILDKMYARYVGFRICHGGKVPVSVSYTSDQSALDSDGNKIPKELVIQYKSSPIVYLDRCFICGVSETYFLRGTSTVYEPICPTPCGTVYPPTPLVTCTQYPPISACDNLGTAGQGDDVPIVVIYSDCGNGLIVNHLIADADGALVPYDLIGDAVDCQSGELIPSPEAVCDDFTLVKMYTMASNPPDGLLNKRDWHDTEPVISSTSATTTETGTLYRERHDFGLTPTTAGTQNSLGLNDVDNTAVEMDVQVVEGYVVVDRDIYLRYNSASEGYVAVELGECLGELELKIEDSGFPYLTDYYKMPKGVHELRLWNLDLAGSNSSLTQQYSYDKINWTNDNTPPGITLSTTAPVEECVLVKVCKSTGEMFDFLTGASIDKSDYYVCSKLCTPSGGCGCSGDCSGVEVVD